MADKQRSLVLIKPDAVRREIAGTIISVYEDNGLKIVAMKMLKLDRAFAEEHYAEHKGKSFFEDLIRTITSSELIAMVLEGEDAIERVRALNGKSDPEKAAEGTIRNRFGLNATENTVHASDCPVSAEREIAHWFPELK